MKKYYFKDMKGHYRVFCNPIDSVWATNSDRNFDSIRRAKQFAKKNRAWIYVENYENGEFVGRSEVPRRKNG